MDKNKKEEPSFCLLCGSGEILENKCKIICQNCGYKRDCTDP